MTRAGIAFSTLMCLVSCAPGDNGVETAGSDSETLYVAEGDLAEIRGRGTLRVLVPRVREDHLERTGSPEAVDHEMLSAFGERLGLEVEFIPVESRTAMLDLLELGYGDIVAAQLTVTPERRARFRFSLQTASVSEWLVGRRGEPNLPRRPQALDGREVHVRESSAFAQTLARIAEEERIDIRIVYVPEELDTETLVYEVSRGKRPLTIVDSNLLESIETYNEEVERLLVLEEGRELAWAMREDAAELEVAVNAFITERNLSGHRAEDVTTAGLEAIRSRGSLRVITLNNPVNYFLYRGKQMGFDYEIARLAAARLGVRLEMMVPSRRDLVFEWLLEGRGDVIATTLSITPERQEFLAFSHPYLYIEELLVQSSHAESPVSSPADLEGRRIHAWRSSSHFETLQGLERAVGPFEIVPIPEDYEFEQVLDLVGAGDFPLAVLDSHVMDAELPFRDDVKVALSLDDLVPVRPDEQTVRAWGKAVAFAMRPENEELAAFMNAFVDDLVGSLELNDARKRYFSDNRRLERVKERRAAVSGRLSPYDELFKLYSRRYGLDWRLMAAQAFQESGFDPKAESWAGARGMFQLLPTTGEELGFDDVTSVETGIHAGIMYMHVLLDRLDHRIPLRHRLRFALAAYNAGWGHLEDARRLAEDEGLDPNKWFGHVEQAMLLLRLPEYYRHARYGYVRGTETVRYVSEINNRYDHYVTLVPPE